MRILAFFLGLLTAVEAWMLGARLLSFNGGVVFLIIASWIALLVAAAGSRAAYPPSGDGSVTRSDNVFGALWRKFQGTSSLRGTLLKGGYVYLVISILISIPNASAQTFSVVVILCVIHTGLLFSIIFGSQLATRGERPEGGFDLKELPPRVAFSLLFYPGITVLAALIVGVLRFKPTGLEFSAGLEPPAIAMLYVAMTCAFFGLALLRHPSSPDVCVWNGFAYSAMAISLIISSVVGILTRQNLYLFCLSAVAFGSFSGGLWRIVKELGWQVPHSSGEQGRSTYNEP